MRRLLSTIIGLYIGYKLLPRWDEEHHQYVERLRGIRR